ncbi:cytochrome c3 family protein [Solemya velum gill symbiont]|uniref:Cytochrome C n=1 Tax=Solemya velum gill symbiont TaxID=2340 RepID=A0A0B0HAV2_SOVGS|nr:NapC/NirT family cytochrome c [Solemya velum gill symbiont]KHF25792.1 nitrate/TMAO reductase, membrane-bound tetraheme cytochrome c subunit [Solemya velum gill symbiont]OOY35622.1 cytochrome C [Solemya velum gill symbiont]OOY38250.1 cytochrome C [Solemya velum gill symbiont]OOY39153.1 cytochrome C [Solemya velum gill symbiont]OOY44055.1 cytochrome C [Solemya velum gill symbiont]
MSNSSSALKIGPRIVIALVVAGLSGVIFMLTLIEFDHLTSTEEFCTTCHSMELAAVPYRESSHYNPASGVRASCGDCHVSEGVLTATFDHVMGTKDLLRQIFGPKYDNPVVNLLHLPDAAFAAREWFNDRNSATCMRCHVKEAIIGKRTDTLKVHQEDAKGKGCVECHINLVHRKVPGEKTFKRDGWNRMVEEEFNLETGMAEKILRGDVEAPAVE